MRQADSFSTLVQYNKSDYKVTMIINKKLKQLILNFDLFAMQEACVAHHGLGFTTRIDSILSTIFGKWPLSEIIQNSYILRVVLVIIMEFHWFIRRIL